MRKKKYLSIIVLLVLFILVTSGLSKTKSRIALDSRYSDNDSAVLMNGGSVEYEWWDTNWNYRTLVQINATSNPLVNSSLYITHNFTKALEDIGASGSLDENSIRMIEQDTSTGVVISELSSQLFKYSNWNPSTNAEGDILFKLNGTTPLNANRTLFVYFDTTDNGPKQAPNYPEYINGWWEQFYGKGVSSGQFTEDIYAPPTNLQTTTYKIEYSDQGAPYFPAGADGPSPDWDYFAGNWTGWIWIPATGRYDFRLYTDDGSWMFVNNTEIVNNGGNHAPRSRNTTIQINEGLHSVRVAWYEHGGRADVRVYWTAPGDNEYILNGSAVAAFEYSKPIDVTNPPSITIGPSAASYIVRVHVNDKGSIPVQGTNVSVYNDSQFMIKTGTTDANGNITFYLAEAGNYTVVAKNETAYPQIGNKVWVNNTWSVELTTSNQGLVTDQIITLPLATVTLHFKDLNDLAFSESVDEHTYIRIWNATYGTMVPSRLTDSDGNITLSRIPIGSYVVTPRFDGIDRQYLFGEIPNQTHTFDTSLTKNVTLPITSVMLQVLSYDNEPVPSATVTITSQDYTAQVEANMTVSTGYVGFKRILNGTWNIQTSRQNTFGQTVSNSTLLSWQSNPPTGIIEFPFTTLTVFVDDGTNPISGANVTVRDQLGSTYVSHGSTNGSGYIDFHWIKNGTYNVTATFLASSDTDIVGTPNQKITLFMTISIAYGPADTVLIFKNETFLSVKWNDNLSLVVALVNRTDGQPDIPISNPDWLNFTITYLGVTIFNGYWSSSANDHVTNHGDGNYTLLIETMIFKMNASLINPYYITIKAFNPDPYDDPDDVTVICIVSNASTSLTLSRSSISVVWGQFVEVYANYLDISHTPNLSITSAAVTYEITGEGLTRSGTLSFYAANSTYRLFENSSDPAGLNLPIGSYTLIVFATRLNYDEDFAIIPLTIQEVPTTISGVPSLVTEDWDESVDIYVEYNSTKIITGATVNATWSYGIIPAVFTGTAYRIRINTADAPNGTYTVTVNAWKGNYTSQSEMFTLNITSRNTTITSIVPSNEITLAWAGTAEFNLTYYDIDENQGITGATSISTNWTIVYFNWVEIGSGVYGLSFDANIEPRNWTVTVQIHKENYTLATTTLQINILIPITVSPFGDGFVLNPATSYWTQALNFSVQLTNSYDPTENVTGATVTYQFSEGSGSLTETLMSGVYNTSITPQAINPGSYSISVQANRSGHITSFGTVYIQVLTVPSELTTSNGTAFRYYTESLVYMVYWNNTLEGVPIISVSNMTLILSHTGFEIFNTTVDPIAGQPGFYSIDLDTLVLGLTPSATPYILNFDANMLGYTSPLPQRLELYINDIPTLLEAELSKPEVELGRDQTVLLRVTYQNTLLNSGILGANITATLAGTEYDLIDHNNGTYTVELPIDNLDIDAYLIEIRANKQYHESKTLSDIQLEVKELTIVIPLLGPVPVSLVIVGSGGFGLPVFAFVGYIAYRRVTMPYDLKVINKALRGIQKGDTLTFKELKIPDRETQIKRVLSSSFEYFGIKLKKEVKEAAG